MKDPLLKSTVQKDRMTILYHLVIARSVFSLSARKRVREDRPVGWASLSPTYEMAAYFRCLVQPKITKLDFQVLEWLGPHLVIFRKNIK